MKANKILRKIGLIGAGALVPASVIPAVCLTGCSSTDILPQPTKIAITGGQSVFTVIGNETSTADKPFLVSVDPSGADIHVNGSIRDNEGEDAPDWINITKDGVVNVIYATDRAVGDYNFEVIATSVDDPTVSAYHQINVVISQDYDTSFVYGVVSAEDKTAYCSIRATAPDDISIPDTCTINSQVYTIVEIKQCNRSTVQSVTFQQYITNINQNAFEDCKNLTSVDLRVATGLDNIEPYAFFECKNLTNLQLPAFTGESLNLGDYAFSECGFKQLIFDTLPDAKKKTLNFGAYCFASCTNLSDLQLISNICYEWSGTYIFADCTNLTHIYFNHCGGNEDIYNHGRYCFAKMILLPFKPGAMRKSTSTIETHIFEGINPYGNMECGEAYKNYDDLQSLGKSDGGLPSNWAISCHKGH